MFVLNILCHNLLGTNHPEGWVRTGRKRATKRLSLSMNHLGTKDPWVRNNWIPNSRPPARLSDISTN